MDGCAAKEAASGQEVRIDSSPHLAQGTYPMNCSRTALKRANMHAAAIARPWMLPSHTPSLLPCPSWTRHMTTRPAYQRPSSHSVPLLFSLSPRFTRDQTSIPSREIHTSTWNLVRRAVPSRTASYLDSACRQLGHLRRRISDKSGGARKASSLDRFPRPPMLRA